MNLYSKWSKVLFPIFAVGFIFVCWWGYNHFQSKKSLEVKLENHYQRSFHELGNHIEKLSQELGKIHVLEPGQRTSYQKGLTHVWRYAHLAKMSLTQLPLGFSPLQETENFLASLANRTYEISTKMAQNNWKAHDATKNIQQLHQYANQLNEQYQHLRQQHMHNQWRWTEVESKMPSNNEKPMHGLIDGLTSIDHQFNLGENMDWGISKATQAIARDVTYLKGEEVTANQIKQKVKNFFQLTHDNQILITENGVARNGYVSYDVSVSSPGISEPIMHMNYSQMGGELIYFIRHRDVEEAKLSARQARDMANAFLDQAGYSDMTAIHFDQHQQVAAITFAKRHDQKIIYPQQLTLQVALDNGEILAMDASSYVFSKKETQFEPMKWSLAKAQQALNPNFEIAHSTPCVILNDQKNEVACYEFWGKMDGKEYRVWINGDSGDVEKMENVRPRYASK